MMNTQQAVSGFSQGEKIKSAIIWASQLVQQAGSLQGAEKTGAEKILDTLLNMIAQEAHLTAKLTRDDTWTEAMQHIDTGITMARSGAFQEVPFHLTQALSRVTTAAQRAMSALQADGLFTNQ